MINARIIKISNPITIQTKIFTMYFIFSVILYCLKIQIKVYTKGNNWNNKDTARTNINPMSSALRCFQEDITFMRGIANSPMLNIRQEIEDPITKPL